MTVITQYELLAGASSPKQEVSVRTLLETIPVLPLDTAGVDCAAKVRQALEHRGESIGMADSLIAGIVIANGTLLLTRNRRHFQRVEGLRLVDQ